MREVTFGGRSLATAVNGDAIRLPRRSYKVEAAVSGGMGAVVLAEVINDGSSALVSNLPSQLALKVSKNRSDSLISELQKWSLMMHPNILTLDEILISKVDGYVAASQRCNGSLRTILDRKTPLTELAAYSVIRSCADALAYSFEKHGVLHLDVKPENILYQENRRGIEASRFLVTDWGISSSKLVADETTKGSMALSTNNNAGTVPYMAPERFVSGWRSSQASDIFSIGILWLEMLCNALPYHSNSPLIPQILTGDYYANAVALLESRRVRRRVQKVILDCLVPDPEKRIDTWPSFHKRISPYFLRRLF